jgi:hypothetical protein
MYGSAKRSAASSLPSLQRLAPCLWMSNDLCRLSSVVDLFLIPRVRELLSLSILSSPFVGLLLWDPL